MYYNGILVKRNNNILCRFADGIRDKDLKLNVVPTSNMVFCRKNDCLHFIDDEYEYISENYAPVIPVTYKSSNCAFGVWRKKHSIRGDYVICADGIERFVTEWMECIMYVVNNEKVYTGKLKLEIDIGLIKSDLSKLRLYKRYSNYLDYNSFMLTLEGEPIKDYSCDELKDYNKLDKRFFHCLYREDVVSAVKCMEEFFDSSIYKSLKLIYRRNFVIKEFCEIGDGYKKYKGAFVKDYWGLIEDDFIGKLS